jgi:hypothetical protein
MGKNVINDSVERIKSMPEQDILASLQLKV